MPEQTGRVYVAEFLHPNAEGSAEEAGWEFANAQTEPYRKMWWDVLVKRVRQGKTEEPK